MPRKEEADPRRSLDEPCRDRCGCSPGGEKLMGWHVNNGPDKMATFYPAARFRASLYRPDVVQRVLAEGSVAKALAAADKARGRVSIPVEIEQV